MRSPSCCGQGGCIHSRTVEPLVSPAGETFALRLPQNSTSALKKKVASMSSEECPYVRTRSAPQHCQLQVGLPHFQDRSGWQHPQGWVVQPSFKGWRLIFVDLWGGRGQFTVAVAGYCSNQRVEAEMAAPSWMYTHDSLSEVERRIFSGRGLPPAAGVSGAVQRSSGVCKWRSSKARLGNLARVF